MTIPIPAVYDDTDTDTDIDAGRDANHSAKCQRGNSVTFYYPANP